MKNLLFIIIVFSVTIALQSCATIFGGRHNTLVFAEESKPEAKVYIDGVYVGDAPGRIKLKKEVIQHGSKLVIKAEGFEPEEYLILRKQNAIYTLVDILTAGTGLAIDYATGNIYRPVPRSFNYNLVKLD